MFSIAAAAANQSILMDLLSSICCVLSKYTAKTQRNTVFQMKVINTSPIFTLRLMNQIFNFLRH
jgi:phosphoserine aminotransferase